MVTEKKVLQVEQYLIDLYGMNSFQFVNLCIKKFELKYHYKPTTLLVRKGDLLDLEPIDGLTVQRVSNGLQPHHMQLGFVEVNNGWQG